MLLLISDGMTEVNEKGGEMIFYFRVRRQGTGSMLQCLIFFLWKFYLKACVHRLSVLRCLLRPQEELRGDKMSIYCIEYTHLVLIDVIPTLLLLHSSLPETWIWGLLVCIYTDLNHMAMP